ncbi:hypothetical protein Plhal304r1_c005g0019251 [Plasmopara halstedii]
MHTSTDRLLTTETQLWLCISLRRRGCNYSPRIVRQHDWRCNALISTLTTLYGLQHMFGYCPHRLFTIAQGLCCPLLNF